MALPRSLYCAGPIVFLPPHNGKGVQPGFAWNNNQGHRDQLGLWIGGYSSRRRRVDPGPGPGCLGMVQRLERIETILCGDAFRGATGLVGF